MEVDAEQIAFMDLHLNRRRMKRNTNRNDSCEPLSVNEAQIVFSLRIQYIFVSNVRSDRKSVARKCSHVDVFYVFLVHACLP